MKFTTIYLGENKIEIFNSILGKETIKVNGATISTKYSALGTEHHFKLMENEVESDCKIITGMGLNGVVIDLKMRCQSSNHQKVAVSLLF